MFPSWSFFRLIRTGEDIVFDFKYSEVRKKLSPDVRKLLEKRGYILKGLADCSIQPKNDVEKHFVEMCRGNVEPQNMYEEAWSHYITLVKEEEHIITAHKEEIRNSPEFRDHNDSLFFGDENRVGEDFHPTEIQNHPSDNSQFKKCPICGGAAIYDCWKCDGRGYL